MKYFFCEKIARTPVQAVRCADEEKLKCFTRGTVCEILPAEQRHTINTLLHGLQENIFGRDLIFHSAASHTNTKPGSEIIHASALASFIRGDGSKRHFERGTVRHSVHYSKQQGLHQPGQCDSRSSETSEPPRLHWKPVIQVHAGGHNTSKATARPRRRAGRG